jgi:hypothetical protein
MDLIAEDWEIGKEEEKRELSWSEIESVLGLWLDPSGMEMDQIRQSLGFK